MSKLENLVNGIDDAESAKFDWDRDKQHLIDLISDLHLKADVDGDNMYISVPINAIKKATGEVRLLTGNEIDEWAVSGNISGLDYWGVYQWASILFNFTNGLIKIFISTTPELGKEPRQNFAMCFLQNKDYLRTNLRNKPNDGDFDTGKYQFMLSDFEYADVFKSLRRVVKYATSNKVTEPNFYAKINIGIITYLKDPNEDLRDGAYTETRRRDVFATPLASKLDGQPLDDVLKRVISGMSYDTPYVKYPKEFKDAPSTSVIDPITGATTTVTIPADEQALALMEKIRLYAAAYDSTLAEFEKVYLLNLSKSSGDASKNYAKVSLTKMGGKVYPQLESDRNGVFYAIVRKGENPYNLPTVEKTSSVEINTSTYSPDGAGFKVNSGSMPVPSNPGE
jgi:hypothetical protein